MRAAKARAYRVCVSSAPYGTRISRHNRCVKGQFHLFSRLSDKRTTRPCERVPSFSVYTLELCRV